MARIDIERKRSPVWPWILGVILVVVLVWILIDTNEREETTDVTTVVTEPGEESGITSDEVQTFLNTIADTSALGMQHEYTSNTIQQMSDALEYIADNSKADVEIQSTVAELNTKADNITRDPESTEHADKIKDAFVTTSDLISQLQESIYPDLNQEAQDVEQAAQNVNGEELTLSQKDEIHTFFQETAQVVRAMSMQIVDSGNNDENM
jgi:phenylalanyl-tRNA synthetase alpha subunit